ncbi:MAG: ribosome-associated translation inhibitor RaiA [Prosthecochloris sp.]|uniref:Sigma 54 modulation protein/ribosomal protein S30EA n=1 Tax=Prosthecochloris aestuarii (strain DSM 271 / SK 413) TaxID=290512 RepID=B4S5H7_PROA2|nr:MULTISPECIES: ribosome-associated translation inhibitor RaiA [Prosthecochloris]ACF45574.1 sigma 54 modulation protein/ribosomal protein S30EA [Prosthecochloris aestuarii DSM 271]MCW8798028.1 ribosome-associated translation inhibitor RaiA [Prosthecochloris sp.]NEX11649.1 ribosome-associated translation inhibitor RaiA [Prosthecochloris sp.]RDD30908.1 ribosomal subunit interface protein [Prosthecochloris sp. ZM]
MTKAVEVNEAVNVQVTLRHTHNHHEIEQYARDAVQSLDKLFSGIINSHVILDHQNNDYENNKLAEVTVHVPQQVLVAKEAGATYEQAIDSCVDIVGRQLKKYKEKLQAHK